MNTVNASPPHTPHTPCILLTGFDAFGGFAVNPSWLAVQALDRHIVAGHEIVAAQLPTEFRTAQLEIERLISLHRPELIIGTGQAGGRAALSLERVALNICHADIADNLGEQPTDLPVIAQGPAAYFSTLPVMSMLEGMQRAGVQVELSTSAGTFVCNHVFYSLMHLLAGQERPRRARAGFIHIPFLPEQGSPSMHLKEIVEGLRLAVKIALAGQPDVPCS